MTHIRFAWNLGKVRSGWGGVDGIVLDLPQVPALREDDMEDDVYLKNKHREIKKWYNEQADLQAKWGWCKAVSYTHLTLPTKLEV